MDLPSSPVTGSACRTIDQIIRASECGNQRLYITILLSQETASSQRAKATDKGSHQLLDPRSKGFNKLISTKQ